MPRQTLLFVIASTILPTATSFEATCAFGVYAPGVVPLRVVLAERHEHEVRHRAVAVHLLELLDEAIRARVVAGARRLRAGGTLLDLRIAGRCSKRVLRTSATPRRLPMPKVFTFRPFCRASSQMYGVDCSWMPPPVSSAAVPRVAERPGALRELGRVGRRRPGLAVLRDFAAAVEVVEQHELLGERVLVRRDVAAEERQARIAVALLQIAEHLIVGAVLFHDEEDVLDRRRLADLRRNHRVARRRPSVSSSVSR